MPIMNWDKSLDIGVPAMNEDHQEILDLMNKIYDARAAGREGLTINSLVSQLGACCTKHFADEERYMAQIGYPDLEPYKLMHKKLLLTYGEHAAQIKDAGGRPSDAFFNFLKFWLSSHIKGIDTKYAAHSGAKVN